MYVNSLCPGVIHVATRCDLPDAAFALLHFRALADLRHVAAGQADGLGIRGQYAKRDEAVA